MLLQETDPLLETEVLTVKLLVLELEGLELAKGLVFEVLDLGHELRAELLADLGLEVLLGEGELGLELV